MMQIGIDLGGTKTEIICLRDGSEIYRNRVSTPQEDYSEILNTIVTLIHQAEQETSIKGSIGIGIPGCISAQTHLVKNANTTCLIGKPFQKDLERLLERAVKIENDANCFTLSEATDGAGQDYSTVFGVILGTGCGGGLAVEGKVIQGRNRIAGEWGHNPLGWMEPNEVQPECYCGKKGCIETFVSGKGLEQDYQRVSGKAQLSAKQIAESNEPDCLETLQRYENRLARALASVINIFDPDCIVLGGGISNMDRLYNSLPRLLPRYVFSDYVETRIVKNQHGDSSGVRGAAWLGV